MKRFLLMSLVVLALINLVACGNKEEVPAQEKANTPASETTNPPEEIVKLSNDEMYGWLIKEYQDIIADFDLDDVEAEAKLPSVVSDALIMHIARYASNGVKLTYAFYDVNKNGIDELLLGADNGLGVIYSYDDDAQTVVKIAFLNTLERGAMQIYDNGTIIMEGSGGAALHYYVFGKMSTDGKIFQMDEYILERYEDDSETPGYFNADTGELLEYQSLTEIMDKYVGTASLVPYEPITEETSEEVTD